MLDWISFWAASISALIVCISGSTARRTSLAASRNVRIASPRPAPIDWKSWAEGPLLVAGLGWELEAFGTRAGSEIPAASAACASLVFIAVCCFMTRLTASLLTTALKAGSCVTAPGAAVGLPVVGGGGAAGGGVTGFQACCATIYAVVPGVAAGPICGGTGGGVAGAAACAVGAADCVVGWPDGCGG